MNYIDSEITNHVLIAAHLLAAMPDVQHGGLIESDLLFRGGSDRSFIRLTAGSQTAVALIQPCGGDEFNSYLTVGEFLQRNGIGVPTFFGVDREKGVLLMEDLGDLHLEDALRNAESTEELSLYRGCIEILVRLETSVTSAMEDEGILADRLFDEDTLLGETDYFMREFIGQYCQIDCPPEWEQERRHLAKTLASLTPVFMHRDFQSSNIMIKEGRLRIIDFQTAHRGPGIYDAASLLKDPYHPLPLATQRMLLKELHDGLQREGAKTTDSFEEFYHAFTLAGIQRNLQALAAFTYLGFKKGKKEFLDSIPNGLRLLEEGIQESGGFSALRKMVQVITQKKLKG